MLPQTIRTSIDTLYDAGFDQSLWQDGLSQLCRAIGTDSAITVPRIATEDTLHLPFSVGVEEFVSRFVDEGWHANDFKAQRGWPVSDVRHRIVLEQDIATEEIHRREPIYQELMLPFDKKWWSGITFRTSRRQYVLSVFRSERAEMFSEDDRQLFDVVSDHLARVVTIAERIGWQQSSASIAMLDGLGEAALLLDSRGRVIELTQAAERHMGDALTILAGRITARDPVIARRVQTTIDRALAEGPASAPPLRIDRPGKRPLLLDLLPVPEQFSGVFIFARFIVLLTDLENLPRPDTALLRHLFALTPAESQIALDLVEGLALSEAAEKNGVTRETAKTHLKAIFHKTGTSRQGALISLIRGIMRNRRSP